METIGPDFQNSLEASGLLGLPFSWDAEGNFYYGPTMTDAQIAAVKACYAAYVPNSLGYAQSQQSDALSAACSAAISSGFASGALGSTYTYPSTLQDQTNQNTIAGCSAAGSLWCEAGGVWAMKPHTQAQAQAVVASFSAWLNACQQQLVTLTNQVSAATSVAAVQAISWTDPNQP